MLPDDLRTAFAEAVPASEWRTIGEVALLRRDADLLLGMHGTQLAKATLGEGPWRVIPTLGLALLESCRQDAIGCSEERTESIQTDTQTP